MEFIPTGSLAVDCGDRHRRLPARPRGRDLRPGVVRQDHARALGDRPGAEEAAASRPSSTPSTRSTPSTPASSASTSTTCWSRSPTTASRRSRSPRCWCARTRVDVVVIDSVAALVPRAELEGEMGDSHVGLQARLMSQALRKLTAIVAKSKTCLVFINQIREKIGVMFGNPETTTGGRALKFYSSVRIDIRRIAAIKEGEEVTGSRAKVKVVKNKVRGAVPPGRVRHRLRRGHLARRRADRPRRRAEAGASRAAPGTTTATCGSARGARTPSSSCATTPTSPRRSRASCARRLGPPRLRRRHPRRGRDRRGAVNRRRAGLAALALALTASASPLRAAGDDTLASRSAGWAIAGRPLALHVEPRGPLADKRLVGDRLRRRRAASGKFDLPRTGGDARSLPRPVSRPAVTVSCSSAAANVSSRSFRVLPPAGCPGRPAPRWPRRSPDVRRGVVAGQRG